MTEDQKSQLTGWIVVGAIVAVLAVGIFYANRNTENDLSNISPAAGEYNSGTTYNYNNGTGTTDTYGPNVAPPANETMPETTP